MIPGVQGIYPVIGASAVAVGGGSGGGSVPFANVKWLSGFGGSDGSTTIPYEGSIGGMTASVNGNAQIDTAQAKFGSSALYLDGTGDYVSSADNANWTPSIGGCCVEAWIRFDPSANLSNSHTIIAHYNATGNQRSWYLRHDGPTGELQFAVSDTGITNSVQVSHVWTPSVSVWYHVAAERSSLSPSTYRLYIDGTMVDKNTSGEGFGINNSTAALTVGALGSPGDYFHGWIDEARFTNGLSVYETDAGFTVPSAAFPRS